MYSVIKNEILNENTNRLNIFSSIAVLAIAAMAAWNVSVNKQTEGFSTIMLANVEALANGENNNFNTGYDKEVQIITHYMNGTEYKKTEITNCYSGGSNSCTPGCKYKVKYENGTWTDWLFC